MQSSSFQDSQTADERLYGPLLDTWLDRIRFLAGNWMSVKVFITYAWPKLREEDGIHDFLKCLRRHLMRAGIQVWLDHYTMGNNPGVYTDQAMRQGIAWSNAILMIGTQTYKQRSEQNTNVKLEVDCITAEFYRPYRHLSIYPLLYRGDFGTSFPARSFPRGLQNTMVLDCREGQSSYNYYHYILPSLAITLLGRSTHLLTAYEQLQFAICRHREQRVPSTLEGAKYHLQKTHERNAEMTTLFGGSWRLKDQGRYVNLAILEEHVQKAREKISYGGKTASGDSVREQHLASFENIYAAKLPILLEKIWETKKLSSSRPNDNFSLPARFLIALGRAGVGKSTCCKYIALMHTQLWPGKFDFVFLVPWRTLTNHLGFYSMMTLSDVLYHSWAKWQGITLIQWVALYSKIAAQPNKVLLLLDGYDELIPQQLNLFHSVEQAPIVKNLLEAPFYKLLTSRPYGVENLRPEARLEITGFTDDNIKTYIDTFFEQTETAQAVYIFMSKNPSIWGVAHIPVTLELLCETWRENEQHLDDDFTLTRLYHRIITSLLRRYLTNRQREGDATLRSVGNIGDLTIVRVWALAAPMLLFLSELAQAGLAEGNLIIAPSVIEHHRVGKPDNILRDALIGGLLKCTESKQTVAQQPVYFIHLTFQEFLTAYALIGSLLSEEIHVQNSASRTLKSIQYSPRYQVVMWFCSGLWDLPASLSPWAPKSDTNRFWQVLLQPPRDMSLAYDASLFVRCIEEAAQTRKLPQFPRSFKEAINFVTRLLKGFSKKLYLPPECLTQALSLSPHFMSDYGITAQLEIYEANNRPKMFASLSTREQTCQMLLLTWVTLEKGLQHCADRMVEILLNQEEDFEPSIMRILLTTEAEYIQNILRPFPIIMVKIRILQNVFSSLNTSKKNQAWKTILQASQHPDDETKAVAIDIIGKIYLHLDPSQQTKAIEILTQGTINSNDSLKKNANKALENIFLRLNSTQQDQVWASLIRAVTHLFSTDITIVTLGNVFLKLIANKQIQAFSSLTQPAQHSDLRVRSKFIKILSNLFQYLDLPQKNQSLQILILAAREYNEEIQSTAVEALGTVFPYLDSYQQDQAYQVISTTGYFTYTSSTFNIGFPLGHVFSQLNIYQQAQTLQILIQTINNSEKKREIQKTAVQALGIVFPYLTFNQPTLAYQKLFQTWSGSKYIEVQGCTIETLGNVFTSLKSDEQNQLFVTLTQAAQNDNPSFEEYEALEYIFPHLNPDQQSQSVEAIIRAAYNDNENAQKALGNVFHYLNDTLQAKTSQFAIQYLRDLRLDFFLEDFNPAMIRVIGKMFSHMRPEQPVQVLQPIIQVFSRASNDCTIEADRTITAALQCLPLGRWMEYHLHVGFNTQTLQNIIAPLVWESRSALVLDAGHLHVYRPQDINVEQYQTPTGLTGVLQGRIRSLETAFKNFVGF